MKKPYWVVIIISPFLTGCISSEKAIQNAIAETQAEIGKIQTAIAETEAAKPTGTSTLTQTFTPEPTITTEPTITQSETPIEPSATLSPTMVPPTETPVPTKTEKVTAAACYIVVSDWCLSHEGCHQVSVRNHTSAVITMHLWTEDGATDKTFNLPIGHCTLQLRPGLYNISENSCGEYEEYKHTLNSKWTYKPECP